MNKKDHGINVQGLVFCTDQQVTDGFPMFLVLSPLILRTSPVSIWLSV